MFLSACISGIYAFDENGSMKAYSHFKKVPSYIAKALASLSAGEKTKELDDITARLKKMGVNEVKSDLPLSGELVFVKDDEAGKMMQELFRKFTLDTKFAGNMGDINRLLTEVNVARSKKNITASIRRDRLLIHAIEAVNDLDDISNRLVERLREWYSLHYPELNREVKDNARYAALVWENGKRESFKGFRESMGMEIEDNDEKIFSMFGKETKEIFDLRDKIDTYLKSEMKRTAPNITALAGHAIAAKLLSLAGGLERLSSLPASTIQLLGAEKALFRHMKGQGKPPKFGVLFAHPEIQNAPKEAKGHVARIIASKIAIAARVDFYSKEDRSEDMKKEMIEKVRAACTSHKPKAVG
ncbi:MAG: hypothetical protein HZB68_04590 [Candidatus Aenigmarchaeota archaeon]|nr:hypothetical protein [Candidatus Aenigmarchaeota archaeon]